MNIIGIETSCDETALAVLSFESETSFQILSEKINSQIDIHQEYGGVYPAVAKREHTKNIYPLLYVTLDESGLLKKREQNIEIHADLLTSISVILERDPANLERVVNFYEQYHTPNIDALAVTYGPGLEIALWTGFNIARALCVLWDIPLVPTNHMEGHIYASLISPHEEKLQLTIPHFPIMSLLISGGHTELLISESEHSYIKIGKTLDDAVGEAYDKSARLIGIPYPGGPEISKLAEQYSSRTSRDNPSADGSSASITLPRPMIHSGDYNFSFSGLKTAVSQLVANQDNLNEPFKQELSYELEQAISEVLIKKTSRALDEYGTSSLVIGGGVSANNNLRNNFSKLAQEKNIDVYLSPKKYSGDNAVMIALAGYRRFINKKYDTDIVAVSGSISLDPETTRKTIR